MFSARLSITGLIVTILSTATTTFLDVYSAGVSSVSISKRINQKVAAVIMCVMGTVLAMLFPVS